LPKTIKEIKPDNFGANYYSHTFKSVTIENPDIIISNTAFRNAEVIDLYLPWTTLEEAQEKGYPWGFKINDTTTIHFAPMFTFTLNNDENSYSVQEGDYN
jgi:hypothetical protein